MELLGLVLRVTLSLVVVLTLLWLAARGLRKSQRKSLGGVALDVLARQPLAPKASLAVVRVGDRALVLGVTEGRIDLLSEQPLASLVPEPALEAAPEAEPVLALQPARPHPPLRPQHPVVVQSGGGGRLDGSALSPRTWSKALEAVRELTVRR